MARYSEYSKYSNSNVTAYNVVLKLEVNYLTPRRQGVLIANEAKYCRQNNRPPENVPTTFSLVSTWIIGVVQSMSHVTLLQY